MLLYIVRHGEPDYTTDTLTERGWEQAEAVGKRMFDAGIQHIYASPYGRARQTAEPACRLLGLPCQIEDWAHEVEDERLTPFPDGEPKSISFVQNALYRADGVCKRVCVRRGFCGDGRVRAGNVCRLARGEYPYVCAL